MKTAEEKARELYPDKEYPDVFGLNMEQLYERSIEHQQILIQRKAFIKGYEYANKQPKVETCNCQIISDYSGSTIKKGISHDCPKHGLKHPKQEDALREAAEFLLERIKKDRDQQRFSVRLALTELEKALK